MDFGIAIYYWNQQNEKSNNRYYWYADAYKYSIQSEKMSKIITDKEKVLKNLQTIPSIGKACALDLWNIEIRSVANLKGQNPNVLYDKLNTFSGVTHDICMLYTFRCAVYFATEDHHEKEKLNWWYWKDKNYNE